MRKKYTILTEIAFILCLLFTISADSQSIIKSQSFDSGASGYADDLSYTVSSAFDVSISNATAISSPNAIRLTNSSIVHFDNIDISSYNNISISLFYKSVNVDRNEDLWFWISYDGGTTYNYVKLIDGNNNENIDWGFRDTNGTNLKNPYIFYVPNGATQIKIAIESVGLDAEEYFYIDNIFIKEDIYCPSYGNSTDNYTTGIRNVTFNTIDNNTPIEDNDYSDFTYITTEVYKGSNYNLSVNVNTDGAYVNSTYAWIDWNQNGDFNDPGEAYNLGIAQNVNNGPTFNSPLEIAIPTNAVIGSTRMRVASKYLDDPISCEKGFDGEVEDYSINIVESYSITTGTISPLDYCAGTNVSIPFTVNGTYNGSNFFTAQLSDASGNFSSPNNIGTLSSTTSGTINGTIPFNTPFGTSYRIRVISNDPVIVGSTNSDNITINEAPIPPTANNNGPVCIGGSVTLTASSISGASYFWTGPNSFTSTLQNPIIYNVNTSTGGDYFVTATVDGCTSEESSTTVNIIQNNTWTGSISEDWNTPANWDCNLVPQISSNVIINLGVKNYPVLNIGGIGAVNNVTIQIGASLTIIDNTLEIAGTISNNGTLNAINGTITFNGTSVQDIEENTFMNNRVENLTIDNSSGVSLSGSLEITGMVLAKNGNLNSNGFLTLISNNSQTALIDGSGNGEVLGSVSMQRLIDPAFGYKYVSTPFSNSKVGDYQSYIDLTSPFPNFYRYNEARNDGPNRDASGWESYTTITDPLNVMEGYAANFGDQIISKTIELSGIVNNGPQQITLQNNNRLYTKGFNLVGNPYPSPIDWDTANGWDKTNIDNALYFFTTSGTDQFTGSYSSYVNGIQSADGKSSNIIPSMQGFFVRVSDPISNIYPVNTVLKMTNEVRVNNFNQDFVKSTIKRNNSPILRIVSKYESESKTDATVIYLEELYDDNFDKEKEAIKLMNTDTAIPNVFTKSKDEKYLSINAISINTDQNKRVPLGVKSEKDAWIELSIENNYLPSSIYAYLIDLKRKTAQNLEKQPSYRFYQKAGETSNRFQILFSQSPIIDAAILFDELFSVRVLHQQAVVKMNLNEAEEGILQINTLNGQNIISQPVVGKNEYVIEGISTAGIYLFSIKVNNRLFTKKILIAK